jgi:hypothetical protein
MSINNSRFRLYCCGVDVVFTDTLGVGVKYLMTVWHVHEDFHADQHSKFNDGSLS